MMRFMWDPRYSVNIKSIDRQHQTFFEIVNELYIDYVEGEGTIKQLRGAIEKLEKHGEFHLSYEENYFKEFKYPQTKQHIKQHDLFRRQIDEFQIRLRQQVTNQQEAAKEVAEFTQNWLNEHIVATDLKYVEFFLTHDVK